MPSFRPVALALALAHVAGAALAAPARADDMNMANVVEPAAMVPRGHWRVRSNFSYTPYFQTLRKSVVQLKDCDPANPDPLTCGPGIERPVESRHYAEAATSIEYGVGDGLGVILRLPLAYVQQYSADSRLLPPYMASPVTFGAGDVSLGVRRALVDFEDLAVSVRFGANVPPGTHPLGNEILRCEETRVAGVPVLKDYTVFTAAPSADFGLGYSQALLPDLLSVQADFSLNYPFRRIRPESVVTWRGMRYNYGMGLEFQPIPGLGLHLDSLVVWANPAEQIESTRPDHILVCETGHFRADIVPGISYRVSDDLTIRASAVRPFLLNGFQRDFPFLIGVVGFTLDI